MNFLPQNANTAATGRLPWLATSSGREEGGYGGPSTEAAAMVLARRIQAFLVSGLKRTGPGNQGGVTVT